ncbi:unnamed protein product [Ranitomeya imitator]|uniref:Uncharacterized protein n=1 Tax=Ranitomeya imitator TaxID=111125 RepID=A0ABN9M1Q4_9NEOB|nr:unnamed protein product [Ranitomeya imitator]
MSLLRSRLSPQRKIAPRSRSGRQLSSPPPHPPPIEPPSRWTVAHGVPHEEGGAPGQDREPGAAEDSQLPALDAAAIRKHCAVLKEFCTPWAAALTSDDSCSRHFPISSSPWDYLSAGPSLPQPEGSSCDLTGGCQCPVHMGGLLQASQQPLNPGTLSAGDALQSETWTLTPRQEADKARGAAVQTPRTIPSPSAPTGVQSGNQNQDYAPVPADRPLPTRPGISK